MMKLHKINTFFITGLLFLTGISSSVLAQAIAPYLQAPTENSIWVSWVSYEPFSGDKVKFTLIEEVSKQHAVQNLNREQSVSKSIGAQKNTVEVITEKLASGYYYKKAHLKGLNPNTNYEYRIFNKDDQLLSGSHRFKTPPRKTQSKGNIRFVLFGDHQALHSYGEPYKLLLSAAEAKIKAKFQSEDYAGSTDPRYHISDYINLVINDGDQVMQGGYIEQYRYHFNTSSAMAKSVPFMTTVGNHEGHADDDNLENYFTHYHYDQLGYTKQNNGTTSNELIKSNNEAYYSYQIGQVLFIHLNSTEWPQSHRGEGKEFEKQEEWLKNIVDDAATNDNVKFIISVRHHPSKAENYWSDVSASLGGYSVGVDEEDERLAEKMAKLKAKIGENILDSTPKHVLSIAGHHHLYARGQSRGSNQDANNAHHHIISGGVGSGHDQSWDEGLLSKRGTWEHPDVQKTIANWTWQLVDLDLEKNTMVVETYAEAHPEIYNREGDQYQQAHYESKLIDRFEHVLKTTTKPDTPTLQAMDDNGIVKGSKFASKTTGAQLNSTQFQVVKSGHSFELPWVDSLRHYEKFYRDEGESENVLNDKNHPVADNDYEPVDKNKYINILNLDVADLGLDDEATYLVKVRYRDRNLNWSNWSQHIEVKAPKERSSLAGIHMDKTVFNHAEPISVKYSNITHSGSWVGLYKEGESGGEYLDWQWSSHQMSPRVTNPNHPHQDSGRLQFDYPLEPGAYYFGLAHNHTFIENVNFYVGSKVSLITNKKTYILGDQNDPNIIFTFAGVGSTMANHSIKIQSVKPDSTSKAPIIIPVESSNSTGLVTFDVSTLDPGHYYASYFISATKIRGGEDVEVSHQTPFEVRPRGNTQEDNSSSILFTNTQTKNMAYFGSTSEKTKTHAGTYKTGVEISYVNNPSSKATAIRVIPRGASKFTYGWAPQYCTEALLATDDNDAKSVFLEGLADGSYTASLVNADQKAIGNKLHFVVDEGLPPTLDFIRDDEYVPGNKANWAMKWENVLKRVSTPWIGIYASGDVPGETGATAWQYIKYKSSKDGKMVKNEFNLRGKKELPQGDYFAAIFANDGYCKISPEIKFTIY
jgi:hypothetical protein